MDVDVEEEGDLYHKQSSLLESCNKDSLGDC